LNESVNIWFTEKRDTKVVLSGDKEVAGYFKIQKYLPLQKITKENKDGSLIIETTICHYMEVIPAIQRWLSHMKGIRPKKLKEQVMYRIKSYLKS